MTAPVMSDRCLFECVNPDGSRWTRIIPSVDLTGTEALAARVDDAVDQTVRMLGVHPTDAALILSMVGLDHERDELGYQRVCQQSGVLPL